MIRSCDVASAEPSSDVGAVVEDREGAWAFDDVSRHGDVECCAVAGGNDDVAVSDGSVVELVCVVEAGGPGEERTRLKVAVASAELAVDASGGTPTVNGRTSQSRHSHRTLTAAFAQAQPCRGIRRARRCGRTSADKSRRRDSGEEEPAPRNLTYWTPMNILDMGVRPPRNRNAPHARTRHDSAEVCRSTHRSRLTGCASTEDGAGGSGQRCVKHTYARLRVSGQEARGIEVNQETDPYFEPLKRYER